MTIGELFPKEKFPLRKRTTITVPEKKIILRIAFCYRDTQQERFRFEDGGHYAAFDEGGKLLLSYAAMDLWPENLPDELRYCPSHLSKPSANSASQSNESTICQDCLDRQEWYELVRNDPPQPWWYRDDNGNLISLSPKEAKRFFKEADQAIMQLFAEVIPNLRDETEKVEWETF